jgi:hypothetical protein
MRLEPLGFHDTVAILERSAASLVNRFRIFGVRLDVSPEVFEAAAARVVASYGILGVQSGLAWLAEGADRALIRLLNSECGSEFYRLTPDDLRIPARARGLWRE